MASTVMAVRIKNLRPRQALAVKRKAEQLGLTMEEYFEQLIEHDLALDRKATATPLHELAAPFRKALKGVSEQEIDRIAEKARRPRSASRARR